METSHLNKDFTRFSDPDLLELGQSVYQHMNGNANFPTAVPTPATINAVVGNYSTALGKAKGGTHADVLAKDAARADVETNLASLAAYCNAQTNDAAILATTGIALAKDKEKIGPLSKPENFKVEPGPNAGSVHLSVKAVDRADFYEFQYTLAPATAASVWQTATSKKRTVIIEGLTSGAQFTFRAAAAGSDKSRVWTNVITSFVL